MIDFNDNKQIAQAIQYTNVNPNLTKEMLIRHLEECVTYGFDAAMIAPCWVSLAKDYLSGTDIKVATTLNFPMANDTLPMKLLAIRELAKEGADEFDFPPNPGYLIGDMDEEYIKEIKEIVHVAHEEGLKVKAMLEFGFLNEDQKIKAAQYAYESNVDWVKQSSGWGVGGCAATTEDVQILKNNIQPPCRVKVSGKVNSLEKMKALFHVGAELVGTSSGPQIMEGTVGDINAY